MNRDFWRLIATCGALACTFTSGIVSGDTLTSDDYSFDIPAMEKKPLEMAASIELWPSLIQYNQQSSIYALKYGQDNVRYSDAYNMKAEGSARFQRTALLATAAGVLSSGYVRPSASLTHDARLYECYAKYSPAPAFSVMGGKKLFKWGKGYAFNPVAFAGRPKDLNDIDASLEGYWAAEAEFIRSYDGSLATAAFTGAALPVYGQINEGYLPDKNFAGIMQAYFLLLNTDIDVCLYGDSRSAYRAGVDFSRNISPEWEVHGEYARTLKEGAEWEAVAGTRYLASFNTTFIMEYLHAGESGQFSRTNYLYLKASHPDPFTIVYLTPSAYAIVNIQDGSLMAGAEATYTRFRHMGFTARYIILAGDVESEYGSKLAKHKVEFRVKAMF
ncbi:MAG: hypothetical protein A2268_07270 [Candidatus Raymondbacteria bacterium RifOxyA12_full_50_37]|uniref:Alginate export domain-containing protein n=1 Tax=Candidatus Raymondbacteria bacterium RIFOXYD12_FULL_49_13 TaxID=1817890 RepID=A0A1F7FEI7_UNCRA|nr:MAG: hypothetical protein A2350_11210 [Candidatus Raymondbacteria bacterium RifOxyB12_full_50_8]OGJ89774.1 MAG: hypothetical protein A2268_07270 [Candidatus Raymondbacteria bacterium RifOxyA12_full_50_37]OGJ91182.1 MAG: hypothetical protein A2248_01415 [Candidatus Raymondbacteria bacterium RIFOXYA2_FULL_49_16]OGJ96315.1 MAG: hypothetical protein A2487_00625 [Candidatus Raymondbacteria bacterium RifOxyC12_full_50_8]OGJ97580.1 MAG: hypothetical protein A2453_02180 [Candidatus Raymondbacteria b